MRQALNIAGREVRASFVTPMAYLIIAAFLALGGFLFFTLVGEYNLLLRRVQIQMPADLNLNQIVIAPYFMSLAFVLVFLIPILTMRSISEEKRSGTYELLATSPISVSELVLGKFLGCSAVLLVMLLTVNAIAVLARDRYERRYR